MRILRVVPLLMSLMACSESASDAREATGGTIVIGATSDPDAFFPPAALNMEARQATELVYEYLGDVGVGMNTIGDSGFVKQLASGWQWSADSASITFTINPRATWHDGKRVTSRDVVFSFGVYGDTAIGSGVASALADLDSVTAPDSSTAVFWFKRRTPHQFFDAASLMLILPAHLLDSIPRDSLRRRTASMSPVGSGRFRPGPANRGASFELLAVENHYRGRAKPDRLIWTISPEYSTGLTRLLGGEVDVLANIRIESISQLARSGTFDVISLEGMDYVFMQLNLRRPLFRSRELRRALTMTLDRQAMVTNLFDTLAAVSIGPTVRAYPTTHSALAQIPYDTLRAARALDSLGWRRGSDGLRKKNGTPLRFTAIVPVSSATRTRIAVLIQEQLRLAGITMRIEQMDYPAFQARQSDRDFDVALASWHLGSSPAGVRETWASTASLNYGGYVSQEFDNLIDSALEARSTGVSRQFFTRAHQIIIDDAPAVWLYEPRTILAVNRRIRTTPMRPNSWWLDIGGWSVRRNDMTMAVK